MRSPRVRALVVGALASVLLVGCSGTGPQGDEPSPAPTDTGQGTFIVAAAVDPLALDPALVTDPDSLRITRQIFETLVTLPEEPAPATVAPDPTPSAEATATAAPTAVEDTVEPGLATEWTASDEGRTYSFTLRQDVTFQDGTPFGPSAVCANFDRWFTLTGRAAAPDVSAVYQEVLGGFIDQSSRYRGCTVMGPTQVRIDLATPMPGLLTELTRPQFGIQSPTAMADHGAYDTGGDPRATSYATAHPTGTGPFRFGAWEPGVQVVLLRNPDYWGEKPTVERVLVRTINDPKARAEQLSKGQVDAYDQVTALDAELLDASEEAGIRAESRPAGDLTYLGMDRRSTALADPLVRRAVALAIDPERIVATTMPPGSVVANGLVPGEAGERIYPYDPAEARRLLGEAGVTDLRVRVGYPSGVQQSYLPSPEDLYVAVADQLAEVGITAEPVAMSWPAYLQMLGSDADHPDLHLMGVSAATPERSALLTQLLSGSEQEFGLESTAALSAVQEAPAGGGRDGAVTAAQQELLSDPVVVPLAQPAAQVALGSRVRVYPTLPHGAEVWASVRLSG